MISGNPGETITYNVPIVIKDTNIYIACNTAHPTSSAYEWHEGVDYSTNGGMKIDAIDDKSLFNIYTVDNSTAVPYSSCGVTGTSHHLLSTCGATGIRLLPGRTYIFDTSDATNVNHTLNIARYSNLSTATPGLTIEGTW